MAYDEYGFLVINQEPLPGYDWVNLSLNTFLTTEEIESEKIILAIPLYTRLWTVNNSGKVIKQPAVPIKSIESVLPSDINKTWR